MIKRSIRIGGAGEGDTRIGSEWETGLDYHRIQTEEFREPNAAALLIQNLCTSINGVYFTFNHFFLYLTTLFFAPSHFHSKLLSTILYTLLILYKSEQRSEILAMATSSSSFSRKKEGLGWIEWLRGWMYVIHEMLFQRILASHLQNPLPLPPINDLTCIVTGSTSGIGSENARQLAEAGAHIVMAVRNPKAAHELILKWQNEWSGMGLPLNIEVMELDLLSLESVSKFAEAWNARSAPLHVLINNAGIFSIGEPQKFSKDGYEEHMQVNHLAPALLSILLLPSLIRGSPSRIVNVNSVMHYVGFVDTEDMNVTFGKRKYTSYVGYTGSKLAQIMFSSVLHRRLPSEAGISVVCVSPGVVHTNVARDLPRIVQAAYHLIPYFIFSPQEGSRSALFSATDPQVPEYCELLKADDWPVCAFISHDCRPANPSEEAHNIETSHKLWEKTIEMIGLPSDAVERLIEGEDITCCYAKNHE